MVLNSCDGDEASELRQGLAGHIAKWSRPRVRSLRHSPGLQQQHSDQAACQTVLSRRSNPKPKDQQERQQYHPSAGGSGRVWVAALEVN